MGNSGSNEPRLCPHCGAEYPERTQTFCRVCGKAFQKPRTWKDDMNDMGASMPKPTPSRELRALFVGLPGSNPCGICMHIVHPNLPFAGKREQAETIFGGSGVEVAESQSGTLSMWRVKPGEGSEGVVLRQCWQNYYENLNVLVLALPAAGGSRDSILQSTQESFAPLWQQLVSDPRLMGKRVVVVLDLESDAPTEQPLHRLASRELKRATLHEPGERYHICVNAATGDGLRLLVDHIWDAASPRPATTPEAPGAASAILRNT